MLIRITKEFHFEMAHALYNHDGKCANIHGHSYCLSVTIKGKVKVQNGHPKNGMVIDFSHFKKIINKEIIDSFDHALLFNGNSPHKKSIPKNSGFTNIILTPYQPTCENLIIDFAQRIKKRLPKSAQLFSLKLRETPGSYAEWFCDDN